MRNASTRPYIAIASTNSRIIRTLLSISGFSANTEIPVEPIWPMPIAAPTAAIENAIAAPISLKLGAAEDVSWACAPLPKMVIEQRNMMPKMCFKCFNFPHSF